MKCRALIVVFSVLCLSRAALAVDHRLEPLAEPAPADAVSAEIAKQLQPTGVRVLRGESRSVVDLWLAGPWKVKPDFKPSSSELYPLTVGTLVGVARFKNRGSDFRNQEVPAGVYTIRYAQQPVDGNHVGTSDTRDFLLLTPAAIDKVVAPLPEKELFVASAKSTGLTHPCMLNLLRAGGAAGAMPTLHHDAERELWSVRFQGTAVAGSKTSPLPIEIVVVGHAPE